MKRLLFALLLLPLTALADTVGPGSSVAWDYVDPMPPNVDGFRLYLNGAPVWEGTVRTVALSDVGITQDQLSDLYVVAYNAVGESEASNTLSFFYVTQAPAAPAGVRFSN